MSFIILNRNLNFTGYFSNIVTRDKLNRIVFESDTTPGKAFDIVLLVLIVLSIVVVLMETMPEFESYKIWFTYAEWILTILFTVEYILRIYIARNHWGYIFSFYGVIDLLSIIPTYLSLIVFDF